MTDRSDLLLFTAEEVSRLPGASLLFGRGSAEIFSVTTDSRRVTAGALFVALRGERTDGHKYLGQAVESGASACLVSTDFTARQEKGPGVPFGDAACIAVPDPLKALQKLAEQWVERFPALIRVGITGSSGKTTTKEILGSILSKSAPTVVNEGNLNSEIGLPLSVFRIRPEHVYGIFEMGINKPGEMKLLCGILKPKYGVVTNIGTAHIGLLGGREGIVREKSALLAALPPEGTGFIEEGESRIPNTIKAKILTFGKHSTPGFRGAESLGMEGWNIRLDELTAQFSMGGDHNLGNALCAVSVAKKMGISPENIAAGLEEVTSPKGRGVVHQGAVTIIEDSYNANADSMIRMLDYISRLHWNGRIVLVLGAMKELGDETLWAHEAVGKKAANIGAEAVFLLGDEMKDARRKIQSEDFTGTLEFSDSYEELEKKLLSYIVPGDLILLKGSRAIELERLVEPLVEAGKKGEMQC